MKSKLIEAIKAGIACAEQCPLNTTYHKRVMKEALALLEAPPNGAQLIADERQQQIDAKGFTLERDDKYVEGELAQEATLWAAEETIVALDLDGICGTAEERAGKPRIRQLAIAGALIAAEIDRLQRLEAQV